MVRWTDYTTAAAEDAVWDVIVVGAGLGGSAIGLSLARQGFKVLFLERGKATVPPRDEAPRSLWQKLVRRSEPPTAASRLAHGHWPDPIRLVLGGEARDFLPPLGTGPGGSSAIYSAALERLRRSDFAPGGHAERGPDALPDGWPLDYDAFMEWYARAEALMGVAGTPDPSDPDDQSELALPPPLSAREDFIFQGMREQGLAPYRLHVGIGYKPGCTECVGRLCPLNCKAEGASRALLPALAEHGAGIVLECTVDRLEASGERIEAVAATVNGKPVTFRGATIILAAGTLSTPGVLLRSVSARWPRGIGNDKDLVGRGLMFHVSDFVALLGGRGLPAGRSPLKTLASRALYRVDGAKLGSFQSVGVKLSGGTIHDYWAAKWQKLLPRSIPLQGLPLLIAAKVASKALGGGSLFATILEDFPYRFNRVTHDPAAPGEVVVSYDKTPELRARAARMRELLKARLKRLKPWFIGGDAPLNYGHPLGTCRFGNDDDTSVLTPDNRVRGTDNLYVVDGSFFPSSGGVNPSLTIVANALRVGELIGRTMRSRL